VHSSPTSEGQGTRHTTWALLSGSPARNRTKPRGSPRTREGVSWSPPAYPSSRCWSSAASSPSRDLPSPAPSPAAEAMLVRCEVLTPATPPCARSADVERRFRHRRRSPPPPRPYPLPHRRPWRSSISVAWLFDRNGVVLEVRSGEIPSMEPGDRGGPPGRGRLPRPATGARDPPARPELTHARPKS